MQKLSASCVFHFTSKENLLSILENEFWPRYSREFYEYPSGSRHEIAFPMTCFCDIPLSQIASHIDNYGSYGIGLTKEWAIKNQLNPVLYIEKNSVLYERINYLLSSNWDSVNALPIVQLKKDRYALIYTHAFIKPYEGMQRRDGDEKTVRFYDEREWRYVPKIDRLGGEEIHLSGKWLSQVTIERKNEILRQHKLGFEPNDIQYIVIERENDRLEFVKEIRRIKSRRYDNTHIDILTSKIISAQQIMKDL